VDKPAFQRTCPDCGCVYTVDDSYEDEAYLNHKANEQTCVCQRCFAEFCGMTIEELCSQSRTGADS
jgi:hypothetical protein